MERAGRVISQLKLSRDSASHQQMNAEMSEQIARTCWPVAVGKKIARHTGHVRMVRSTLVVEVEDAVWQKQLHTLRFQILKKLWELMGRGLVEELEFRIQVPRYKPQREETAAFVLSADEADHIPDAVLQLVYRRARKKASA